MESKTPFILQVLGCFVIPSRSSAAESRLYEMFKVNDKWSVKASSLTVSRFSSFERESFKGYVTPEGGGKVANFVTSRYRN